MRALVILALFIVPTALAGCLEPDCPPRQVCDTRLKGALAAVFFDEAFDRAVAEDALTFLEWGLLDPATAEPIGGQVPSDAAGNGTALEGAEQIRADHADGARLWILVTRAHLDDPESAPWTLAVEYPHPQSDRARSQSDARATGHDFETSKGPDFVEFMSFFEARTGWTHSGDPEWTSIMVPA